MKGEVNYTVEMVAEMVKAYENMPTIETVRELAERFGKSEKSVIAKLAREGIYRKQVRLNKAGELAVRKETLVAKISELVGENVESLEKASKQDLIAVLNALAKVSIREV